MEIVVYNRNPGTWRKYDIETPFWYTSIIVAFIFVFFILVLSMVLAYTTEVFLITFSCLILFNIVNRYARTIVLRLHKKDTESESDSSPAVN
jgi:hypothetical protein